MARFWWGVTRPNTVVSSSASASSFASSGRGARVDEPASAPSMPALRATAATVAALSPEMTFRATPCSRKKAKISAASGSDRVLEMHQTHGVALLGQRLARPRSIGPRHEQDAGPGGGSLFGPGPGVVVVVVEQDVGRAEVVGAPPLELRGRPLPGRRERQALAESPAVDVAHTYRRSRRGSRWGRGRPRRARRGPAAASSRLTSPSGSRPGRGRSPRS